MRYAGTYVQITRDELEEWLDSVRLHHHWELKAGKAGVYLLPIGENVAVKLSSTIGTADDAMGRGQASMQLALVSLITNQVLNKKAQGQSHFARTTNWRKNWLEGVERMREAYQKAQGFYDALAVIEDREKYKRDLLARIEAIPGWQQNNLLSDFHGKVREGGILSIAQAEVVIRAEKAKPIAPKPAQGGGDEELLERMRNLYRAATRDGNRWLVEFLTSIGPQIKAGRPLSEKQMAALDRNFTQYGI